MTKCKARPQLVKAKPVDGALKKKRKKKKSPLESPGSLSDLSWTVFILHSRLILVPFVAKWMC